MTQDLKEADRHLFEAIEKDDIEEARRALVDKPDPNAKDGSGSTFLHVAVKRGNPDIVILLRTYGVDPNTKDNHGRTPLHYSSEKGSLDITRLLLEDLDELKDPKETLERHSPHFAITINGNTLNGSTKPMIDASSTDYILLQSWERLRPSQREWLAQFDLVLLDYVSKNTYLYRYGGKDLDQFRQMKLIAYVDVYRLELKIPPALKNADPDGSYKVDIVFHEGADSPAFRQSIEEKSRLRREDICFFPQKARLTIQGQYLADVTAVDGVRLIEKVGEIVLRDDRAQQIIRAGVQPRPALAPTYTYQGEGQVIAVADTGLDNGNQESIHPAFQETDIKWYPLGGEAADTRGHGTHVCGSAVGKLRINDKTKIMGTAPCASLAVQCAGAHMERLPWNLKELFKIPYEDKATLARVHSNSWGRKMEDRQLGYDSSAGEIDDFIWTHQEQVICWAAGNDARATAGCVEGAQIGSEAAAKNCITVGASENYRPENWPQEAQNPSHVADSSSRGPTCEGRFKPDIVAPGTCILSANSTCRQNSDRRDPGDLSCYASGTSNSTPIVAGCAAILREVLSKTKGILTPSAALVKGLILNGADVMGSSTPDVESGFGRVNLCNSIATAIGKNLGGFHSASFNQFKDDEDAIDVPIEIPTGSLPTNFKVTLVWSDPPGVMLKNSLLLEVLNADVDSTKNNNKQKRLGYDSSNYEGLNNVQQVMWQDLPLGRVIIKIKPYDIQILPQPFAVVWRSY